MLERVFKKLKVIKFIYIIKNSGYFDKEFYLNSNSDVKSSNINPIKHYILFGANEGRDPSESFSTNFYLEKYSDVREANINPLIHYILFGKKESREIKENKTILYIDDMIPHIHYGSGFPRANLIVNSLIKFGYKVEIYPLNIFNFNSETVDGYSDIDNSIKIYKNASRDKLLNFIKNSIDRYSHIWISRPHNMQIFIDEVLKEIVIKNKQIIYDAEAIFTKRDIRKYKAFNQEIPSELLDSYDRELKLAEYADKIVSVSEIEAKEFTKKNRLVYTLDYSLNIKESSNKFEDRKDFLFVGNMNHDDSPNVDSIIWFLENVWEEIKKEFKDVKLHLVGSAKSELIQSLKDRDDIIIHGVLKDISHFYNECRVFIAPTRYASGTAIKVIEASLYGIPIVTTDIVARDLGESSNENILEAEVNDRETFATQAIGLYSDRELWSIKRENLLKKYKEKHSLKKFLSDLRDILDINQQFNQTRWDMVYIKNHFKNIISKIIKESIFDIDFYKRVNLYLVEESNFKIIEDGKRYDFINGKDFLNPKVVNKKIKEISNNYDRKFLSDFIKEWQNVENTQFSNLKIAILTSSKGNFFFDEIKEFFAESFGRCGVEVYICNEKNALNLNVDYYFILSPQELFTLGDGDKLLLEEKILNNSIIFVAEQPFTNFYIKNIIFQSKYYLDINCWSSLYTKEIFNKNSHFFPLGYLKNYKAFDEFKELSDSFVLNGLSKDTKEYRNSIHNPLNKRPIDILFNVSIIQNDNSSRREIFLSENASIFSKFNCAFFIVDAKKPLNSQIPSTITTNDAIALSQRSKILLNIHRDKFDYFEWHRLVLRGIWQKCLIVTESVHNIPFFEDGTDYISLDIQDIPKKLEWLLTTKEGIDKAEEIRNSAYEKFVKHYEMTNITKWFLNMLSKDITKTLTKKFDISLEKNSKLKAKTTILITLYNYENYILEALNSVYNQNEKVIDLVIIDDFSQDKSFEITKEWLEKYGDRFNSFKLLRHNKNEGVVEARNSAISIIKSEYIFIMDADNLIFPSCIKKLSKTLDENPNASFTYSILNQFGYKNRVMNTQTWNIDGFKSGNYLDAMALIKREDLIEVGKYSKEFIYGWEDYDLWCKFVEKDKYGILVPEILGSYRTHKNSRTLKSLHKSKKNTGEMIKILKKAHPWLNITINDAMKFFINSLDFEEIKEELKKYNLTTTKKLKNSNLGIDIVCVVDDFELYDLMIRDNSFMNRFNLVTLDNRIENISITKRYNSFIDENINSDSWIIFCHQDFALLEDITEKLATLDKSFIYGNIGAIKENSKTKVYGEIIQGYRTGEFLKHGKSIIKPKVVDTMDCQCIIIHSSLIEKYNLRFDENLEFHHYAEEFCLNAKYNHNILTKVIQLKSIHLSLGTLNSSFYEAFDYVRDKYSIDYGNTCLV